MRVPQKAVLGSCTSRAGIAGYALGKLTGGDLKELLSRLLEHVFRFLHEQGAYASFAIVMTLGFGWFAVWAIRKLIDGKQSEIDRIVIERDRFQALFIDEWKTSRNQPNKGG